MAVRERYRAEDYEAGDDSSQVPCARGNRCEERDYKGNPQLGPRAFCYTDETYIGKAIKGLPRTYVDIHGLLARSEQAEERVSGSRDAPIPLAADVEAFMREIVHVTFSWEERVRDIAKLHDYPDGRRRDSVTLVAACLTLERRLGTLLALEESEFERAIGPKRVEEIIEERGDDEESVINAFGYRMKSRPVSYDSSGQAWERVTMDGTGAGLEFLRLNGRARGMLGLSRQRRRITEVRCDECKSKATLVQYEHHDGGWEPKISCTQCTNVYIGASYDLLMGRVYKVQLDELGRAS